MYAICSSPDLSKIKDEAIIDELKKGYKELVPLYNFLMEAVKEDKKGE